MGALEAAVLGLIQGLTEFLPVSSSGHLELAKAMFGEEAMPDESMLYTVTLHAATALSTIVVFRKEIAQILKGLFQFKNNEETRFSIKIVLSMIPAALVGLLWEDHIETLFNGQILLVGLMLLVTGGLLFMAGRAKKTNQKVGFGHAIIIGISQAIAILPGISRSGATISTSVLLGIDRERAARFSFLMVVPLILGKMAKDGYDMMKEGVTLASDDVTGLSIGFVVAFVTGLAACTWMIALVKRAKLWYFSLYCFAAGLAAIIWHYAA